MASRSLFRCSNLLGCLFNIFTTRPLFAVRFDLTLVAWTALGRCNETYLGSSYEIKHSPFWDRVQYARDSSQLTTNHAKLMPLVREEMSLSRQAVRHRWISLRKARHDANSQAGPHVPVIQSPTELFSTRHLQSYFQSLNTHCTVSYTKVLRDQAHMRLCILISKLQVVELVPPPH